MSKSPALERLVQIVLLVLLGSSLAGSVVRGAEGAGEGSVLEFGVRRLAGSEESLAKYQGDVLLIVNTASRCGYTPQYEGLQALHAKYRDRGFSVLGFPSNDFGAQEPGSDPEIGAFCKRNYGVEFPMFSKVKVLGEGQHPLYAYLASQPEPIGGPVRWNFEKYLVDRSGKVVSRFPSSVKPLSPEVTARLGELLAAPAPKKP